MLGWLHLPAHRRFRTAVLGLLALLVLAVGSARVYLGDHWATDVLGSSLIGLVLLGVTLWVYLELKRRGVLEAKSASTSHHEQSDCGPGSGSKVGCRARDDVAQG